VRGRLIAALTRGELDHAWEPDVGRPCHARIYHCVLEKQGGVDGFKTRRSSERFLGISAARPRSPLFLGQSIHGCI
jgi:hypothetical protein